MVDSQVRRVLIYRLGSLGDTVVALPALRLVARSFPAAERRLLANMPVQTKAAPAAAVLDGSGLVHGYFRYAVGTRSAWELGKLVLQLRLWRPQVLVYLAGARGVAVAERDLRFFRACGVKRVIGLPVTEALQGNFFGHEPGSPAAKEMLFAGELEPEAARLTRCIAELGDAGLDQPESWSLGLTEAERTRAAEVVGADVLAGRPVAMSVGTKMQANRWNGERWRQLLGGVAGLVPGRSLVLLGAREEAEASESVAAEWGTGGGGTVINLCGKLSPRESAAVLERCCLFLGHDSGPMHLAASAGAPVVAVFSARNIPKQWFPFGTGHQVVQHRVERWGCGLETCVEQRKKCIESIEVQEVLAAVQRVLAGQRSALSG